MSSCEIAEGRSAALANRHPHQLLHGQQGGHALHQRESGHKVVSALVGSGVCEMMRTYDGVGIFGSSDSGGLKVTPRQYK